MKKTLSHSKSKPDDATALTQLLFEASETSGAQPPRLTDFLNPTTLRNRGNPLFMPNEGILYGPENKDNRGSLMKVLQKRGVEVQGTTPANQYVVFPQGFQESIPAIVADFLGNLDSVSSAKPVMSKKKQPDAKTPTICSHGYRCAFNTPCCPRVAGGGAAAVPHSSSKSSKSLMTLAQLQKKQLQSENTQPAGQKKIVPSQVRVGQPQQHTHQLAEMPIINSFCEFLADETGSEWNAFAGSNLFSELLNFESREGEQKSRQSRSYSPAVEVDSSDEESVQGDE